MESNPFERINWGKIFTQPISIKLLFPIHLVLQERPSPTGTEHSSVFRLTAFALTPLRHASVLETGTIVDSVKMPTLG